MDRAHEALPTDIFALRDRLHALFSRYGRVQRLDLVRADQGQRQRAMCFLRMATPHEEQTVAQSLGLGRFGGDLVMVVALDEAHRSQNPAWLGWTSEGAGLHHA